MRFARHVADKEYSAHGRCTHPRPDRARRKPRAIEPRTAKRCARTFAMLHDVPQDGVRRLLARTAAALQNVATNAARKTHASGIAMHHAAITTGEDEQRHQVFRQTAVTEMRLEREEIGFGGSAKVLIHEPA